MRSAWRMLPGILTAIAVMSCGGTVNGQAVPPPPPPTPPPGAAPPAGNTLEGMNLYFTMRRVADWPLLHPVDRDPAHWSLAPLYDGLIDVSEVTGDPLYLATVLRMGLHLTYTLGSRRYHADGHAAGSSWLRIFLMDPQRDPDMLQPMIDQFDEIVANPIEENLSFIGPPPAHLHRTDRWTWADALFMSPPTLSLLARATGDERYLAFVDREFAVTYETLFDEEHHLWYRDATYVDDRSPNGEKIFWSRGNGWVYAGLSLMLEVMRPDYPHREFYVELFRQMSEALKNAQQPDGFWYPNLADPAHVPIGETSGTALFVTGMAWGVRRGIIDAETYWPVVERGWRAIETRIEGDGEVGFVQPFGEAPVVITGESKETFGTGTVLMAGTEIMRALGFTARVPPKLLIDQAVAIVEHVPNLSTDCEDNDCDAPD